MDYQHKPFAPGTLLLVRFAAHANRRLGDPGETYFSRQRTTLPVGDTLEVVEDSGKGYILGRRGKDIFRVHVTDLMLKPNDAQVAYGAVEARRTALSLDEATEALRLAERDLADARALAASLAAENHALRLRLTTAQVKLQALVADLDRPVVVRAPDAPDSAS